MPSRWSESAGKPRAAGRMGGQWVGNMAANLPVLRPACAVPCSYGLAQVDGRRVVTRGGPAGLAGKRACRVQSNRESSTVPALQPEAAVAHRRGHTCRTHRCNIPHWQGTCCRSSSSCCCQCSGRCTTRCRCPGGGRSWRAGPALQAGRWYSMDMMRAWAVVCCYPLALYTLHRRASSENGRGRVQGNNGGKPR